MENNIEAILSKDQFGVQKECDYKGSNSGIKNNYWKKN